MILRILPFLLLVLAFQPGLSQENYAVALIPQDIKENANAVVRLSRESITISSRKSMNTKKLRVVTILNEAGMGYLNAAELFDNSTTVRSINAVVYDSAGKEIKKIKQKDFTESSLTEGAGITDGRVLSLDYTPVNYPFTMVYESEVQTSNTAFISTWTPIEGLYVSTQKSEINITYNPDLGFKYKEYNFGNMVLNKRESDNALSLTAENLPVIKREDYTPSLHKLLPHVIFGLDKFNLEGVDGEAVSWKNFGLWMYNTLLQGTDELPQSTVEVIRAKVGTEADPLKKAKIVYEYVQGKTRYISIQLGIGGWKPMKAKDVDRLGYGDCKALTNYTRALLKAVGVDSYYTVVYGDIDKKDMKEDFISMQGNHVILAIPHNGKLTWLECTSQSLPFGFQGNFTDDRMALLIKPEGGEIVKTNVYDTQQNSQVSRGSYAISDDGAMVGSVTIRSKGLQYDQKYSLVSKSKTDLDEIYKESFSNINSLRLKKTNLQNNKDDQEFTEEINIESDLYCSKSGNRMIFAINAFNQSGHMPTRYRSRVNPFEVSWGFYDTDEVVIDLPAGFTVEAKPDNFALSDKFGEYKTEYEMVGANKMMYRRTLKMNEGSYNNNEYESYRLFREKIAKNDNAKIVLVKN